MAEGYKAAAAYLAERAKIKPVVGIICGSGLSGLSSEMTETQVFPYSEIPNFPCTTVAGHTGELVLGLFAGVPTLCVRGRFHFYEGHPMHSVVIAVRVMRCLGVKALVVTNAAGLLNPAWEIGDVVVNMDHFALPIMVGNNPLSGPNDPALGGARFIPVSNAYDRGMQEAVVNSAKALGFSFVRPKGCYAMVAGPSYEAPSEAKFLQTAGADIVGMSTVPEVLAAHHCGMKVLSISLCTNRVLLPGDDRPPANHAEVLETANMRAKQMQQLAARMIQDLKTDLAAMPSLPKIDLRGAAPSKAEGCAWSRDLLIAVVGGAVGALVMRAALRK